MVNSGVFQILLYAISIIIQFFVIHLCVILVLVQCEKVIDVFGQQGTWVLEGLYLTRGRTGILFDFFILFILILEMALILCPFSEMDRKSAYASACILGNMEVLPELRALCERASIFIFGKQNSPSRSP